jgi:hypothetical protein
MYSTYRVQPQKRREATCAVERKCRIAKVPECYRCHAVLGGQPCPEEQIDNDEQ